MKPTRTILDRLLAKLAPSPNGCLVWTGKSVIRGGYGVLYDGNRQKVAHRVAWEHTFGPIPDGMHVCHRCDNPPCCNPVHLFLGTVRDNAADREAKGRGNHGPNLANLSKSECPKGHQYSAENTYVDPRGWRNCRECRSTRQAQTRDIG